MDTTVNTWQMVKALMENPKRKAKSDSLAGIVFMKNGCLKWDDGSEFKLTLKCEGYVDSLMADDWIIIEPPKKLKEMSFGEAYYIFHKLKDLECGDLKTICGKVFMGVNHNTKEEMMGLWTVKGIFEDDE